VGDYAHDAGIKTAEVMGAVAVQTASQKKKS